MKSGAPALVGEAVGVDVGDAVGVAVGSAVGVGVPPTKVPGLGVGVDWTEATGWNRKLHFPNTSRRSAVIAITATPDPPAPSASLVPPTPLQNKLR
jgi:hypothetical protein